MFDFVFAKLSSPVEWDDSSFGVNLVLITLRDFIRMEHHSPLLGWLFWERLTGG